MIMLKLQEACFPFKVQMQGTWLSWGLTDQPGNKLFQPFLEKEKEVKVIISNDSSFHYQAYCDMSDNNF